MGFDTVAATFTNLMINKGAGFIGDFGPLVAAVAGISFAGFALMVIRRFIG